MFDGRVARIHAAHVRAERNGVAVRIHLRVVEVVVALRIGAELRIVLLGRQHQRSAAAPAAHQLRRDQFLLLGCVAVLLQEIAETPDVLLEAPVGEKAAVARQDLGLRQRDRSAVLVGVAEEKLSRLERRARAWRRHLAGSLDRRLRQPIAVAEMVVRVVERRCRLEVECRKHFDTGATRDAYCSCSVDTSLALRDITREEDDDGVEIGRGQATHPVVGMIRARVAEDLRASGHALTELLRERRE